MIVPHSRDNHSYLVQTRDCTTKYTITAT